MDSPSKRLVESLEMRETIMKLQPKVWRADRGHKQLFAQLNFGKISRVERGGYRLEGPFLLREIGSASTSSSINSSIASIRRWTRPPTLNAQRVDPSCVVV